MIGIYKIQNTITLQSYIGSSLNIERRFKNHRSNAYRIGSKAFHLPLYKSIRRYGLSNFSFIILEECKEEDLRVMEKQFLSLELEVFNLRDSFLEWSDEVKANHKNAAKEAWKLRSDKSKEICFDNLKKGEDKRYAKKPIISTNLSTLEAIRFDSLYQASVYLSIPRPSICQVLKGKRNTSHGYVFEYDSKI